LADRAWIGTGTRVADFCAGLGGPARYLAHCYAADVTGIELTPARVKKDTSKLLILVWLWFRSPHEGLAAEVMRTSEPPHQERRKPS
jgi:hypothetical protein